ncbi:MAG: WYL domain-containing protein [Gemmatimonadaceae bacterium]|nr:WYL domain-containing protein [Gemmatimonadaceae bacterium]
MDLLAFLLRHSSPVTWDQIRQGVPDYARYDDDPDTPAAAALEKKFERDKENLRTFGVPITVVRVPGSATDHYRLERRAFYLPYLQSLEADAPPPRRVSREFYRSLTSQPVEPTAIELVRAAAARARAVGDPVLAEQVDGAMHKLAIDVPTLRADAHDGVALPARAAIDDATIAVVTEAVAARRRLSFLYESITDGARAPRTVHPGGLVALQGQWYLVAHDPSRGDDLEAIRTFRVTRMHDVVGDQRTVTPQFALPAGFDLAAYATARQPWAIGDAPPTAVTYEVVRPTGVAQAALEEGEPDPDDPARRTIAVRRPEAFIRWTLAFGGAVRPVAPASIVTAWRETLAAMRGAYGEATA